MNTLPPDDLASLAATYAACATPYTPPSSSSSSSSASASPINSSASTRRLLGLVTKATQDKIDLFKPTDFAELVWGIATHEAAVLALPTASELREPWQATHAFMKAAGGVVSETASRLKPSLFVAMVCAVATVTAAQILYMSSGEYLFLGRHVCVVVAVQCCVVGLSVVVLFVCSCRQWPRRLRAAPSQ